MSELLGGSALKNYPKLRARLEVRQHIAAMYSENDLRHATVMKAAYNRLKQDDDFVPQLNRDLPPSAA